MILNGDASHIPLKDESVQCVVTSPPYWGLRDYGLGEGAIGLEDTIDLYIEHMVDVFREVKRVLRSDGTVWLNLGSSYSSGGTTVSKALGRLLEDALVVFVDGFPIASSTECVDVALAHQGCPEDEFGGLLGAEGDGLKERHENFRQVLHLLAHPGNGRASLPPGGVIMYAPDSQIVGKNANGWKIVGTNGDTETKAELVVLGPTSAGSSKNDERSLAIDEPSNPPVHRVIVWQPAWKSFSANAGLKCAPDVNLMDQAIPLTDGLGAFACPLRDFRVTEAGENKVSFAAVEFGLRLSVSSVCHCRFLMSDGSIIPYRTILAQAIRLVNAEAPKQDLVIPWRVAMALQADGWILRAPIVWSKPNPMPESVQGSHYARHRVAMAEYERLSNLRTGQSGNEKRSGDMPDLSAGEMPCRETPVSEERKGQATARTRENREDVKEKRRVFSRSVQGKRNQGRYEETEKGKETRRKAVAKYYNSEKGKRKASERHQQTKNLPGRITQKRQANQRYMLTEKFKAKKRRDYARRKEAIVLGRIVTAEDWLEMVSRSKNRCYYCRKRKVLTMDHVIPLSKGGKHVKENIVPACRSCNSTKGNRITMLL